MNVLVIVLIQANEEVNCELLVPPGFISLGFRKKPDHFGSISGINRYVRWRAVVCSQLMNDPIGVGEIDSRARGLGSLGVSDT
jgi:hypothetical protein